MDIKTLVELHKVLSELQGGNLLPDTIDPDKLKAISETLEIIEKLVASMKKQAIPYFTPGL